MAVSELKFIISEATAAELRGWARLELMPDPNAAESGGDSYLTRTLYFDTPGFDLFFRRGSQARAKFRIRGYNSGTAIFLERKLKSGNRVYKRRSEVVRDDLSLITEKREDWAGRWFARRLYHRGLRPVCQISYARTARVGSGLTGALRMTIDQNISASAINTFAFTNAAGLELMPGLAILELKYSSALPAAFAEIMRVFRLHPQAVSKYRLAVRSLGLTGTVDDSERATIHA
jgi:hypothetical protein